jgi:hypothetical protein
MAELIISEVIRRFGESIAELMPPNEPWAAPVVWGSLLRLALLIRWNRPG